MSKWREFINFRAEKMKSDIGPENQAKWQHFKASSCGASNDSNGSLSNDLNKANLPWDVAGRREFIDSRAEPNNKFHNSVTPSNEAWTLVKTCIAQTCASLWALTPRFCS